jgi:esterase
MPEINESEDDVPYAQLPDIRLYYEEYGTGDPILCIHGTSSSAMVWDDDMEALSRLGRVIIYDRRGCTRSDRPEPYEATNAAEHADDAAALMEALSATPAIIIGRSYGGFIAIDLALRYPDHVRALILLEGAPPTLSPAGHAMEGEVVRRMQAVAEHDPDRVSETFLRMMIGDETWEHLPDERKAMHADNGPAILAELRGGLPNFDPASLATIDTPALLVAAESSPEPFRQATDVMAAAMPHAETARISGGHLISPTHPTVLGFIERILRPARTGSPSRG